MIPVLKPRKPGTDRLGIPIEIGATMYCVKGAGSGLFGTVLSKHGVSWRVQVGSATYWKSGQNMVSADIYIDVGL